MICCSRQSINRMTLDNAVCTSCGGHWYRGERFSQKAWDALLDSDLQREKQEYRQRLFDIQRRAIQRCIDASYGLLEFRWPA